VLDCRVDTFFILLTVKVQLVERLERNSTCEVTV